MGQVRASFCLHNVLSRVHYRSIYTSEPDSVHQPKFLAWDHMDNLWL
uniref:Uncharacterized protein n=1 Tax=Arundo donax TaxID=35708 RepID=A0A0A9H1F9_ARUDO